MLGVSVVSKGVGETEELNVPDGVKLEEIDAVTLDEVVREEELPKDDDLVAD